MARRTQSNELDVVVGGLPRRLRAERERQSLSVRELARRLDVSPSAISQIETGRARPSVSTLFAIVTELGISLDALFSSEQSSTAGGDARNGQAVGSPIDGGHQVAVLRSPVQRSDSRAFLELETGVRWERLTAFHDPYVDFHRVIYEVGGTSSGEKLMRHPGREYGLVLSGRLEVTVQFTTYDLGPGDSIHFESTQPHRLRNVGTEPADCIWVILGRRGEEPTPPP